MRPSFLRFESGGTVFGSMGKGNLESLPYVEPPANLIKRFDRAVGPIDQMIENNERQAAALATLRDTLLPKLLSGEIRVKQAEKIVEEVV
jgi:type I restriction enzyme S subunit